MRESAAGHGHRRAAGRRISNPDNDRRSFESGWHAALSAGWLLFAPQHQQLSVGCEDLAQSVLKGAAGFDAPADVVHPLFGDAFDTTLPLRHESEKPDGMAFARSAMASGLAAAAMGEGERAGQQVLWEGKLSEAGELTLTEAGGFGTFWADVHLKAIMHPELTNSQAFLRTRK